MKKIVEPQKLQTGNALLISFSHFIHDVYGSFLAPLLPLLIKKLGFSYALAGFLQAAQRLPSLLNPWLGAIADRIQVRYFVILAPAVAAISMSLIGVAPSYSILVILLVITGINSACYHVPTPVIVRQVSGDQVGRGMSFYMFGGELARTLGPLIIVGTVSLWGLEGTYRLILPGMIASLFLYSKFKNMPIQQDFHSAPSYGLMQTVRKFLPLFLCLMGITVFMGGLKSTLVAFLPSYLTQKGYSLEVAGISLAILEGGGVVGVLTSGILSDKFGRKLILLVIGIAVPALMWIFLLAPGIFTLPVLCVLGFFLFSAGPVMLAVVQDSNSDRPAYVNGIYMMINFVLNSVMTIIVGALNDGIGFELTYRISAFWFFGAIPCLLMLPGKLSFRNIWSERQA